MTGICHTDRRRGLLVVNPLENPEWDKILERHRCATLFHGSLWARVISETYGFRPFCLVTENNGACVCLFEVNSWLTGKRGVGIPFTDECAPLEDSEWPASELLEEAKRFGAQRGWRSLEIRGGNLPLESASISYRKHVLSLDEPEDTVFSKTDGSVRRAVRKAEKSGVSVEFLDNLEGMREYYSLHCLTRQKHGIPPQPFQFFANIAKHLTSRGTGFVALARFRCRSVAGAVFLNAFGAGHYKFAASDPAFDHLRPNNLVMWRSMQHCMKLGLKRVDLGRTSLLNPGLHRYKLNWGAREESIRYSKWSFRRAAFLPLTDRSEGTKNLLFRLCPPSLNRLLGAVLYPHIA